MGLLKIKKSHHLSASLLLSALLMTGCVSSPMHITSVSVHVPPAVSVPAAEIKALLPEQGSRPGPEEGTLEVVVLRYHPEYTRISYAGKNFTEAIHPGHIQVLMKFRRGTRLVRTKYLEAKGKTREEILSNIAEKVKPLIQ